MDHVRLDATRRKPARQPEAVAAGFESQRNPRGIVNLAARGMLVVSVARRLGSEGLLLAYCDAPL